MMLKLTMFSWLVVGTVLITVGCQAMVGQIGYDRVKPTAPPTPTVIAPTVAAPLTHTTLLTYYLRPTITIRHTPEWRFEPDRQGIGVYGYEAMDKKYKLTIDVREHSALDLPRVHPGYWATATMLSIPGNRELIWQKKITTDHMTGLIYLESDGYSMPQGERSYAISAYLESQPHQLELFFELGLGHYPTSQAYETIAPKIEADIELFEQLVQSVALPPLPQIEPTAPPFPNPLPQPPIITDWSMAQISWYQVPYPTGWFVMKGPNFTNLTDGHITIPQAITSSVPPNYIIQFSDEVQYLDIGEVITTVEDLAPAVELLVDKRTDAPMTSRGDEYARLWQQPLTNEDTLGLLYVWGVPHYWEADDPVLLVAAYYHPPNRAQMVLSTSFDPDSVQLAHQHGFTETIAERFSHFTYMAEQTAYHSPLH